MARSCLSCVQTVLSTRRKIPESDLDDTANRAMIALDLASSRLGLLPRLPRQDIQHRIDRTNDPSTNNHEETPCERNSHSSSD